MDIEQLLLRKEELPILHENCFEVPIHPRLLDKNIMIRENIASQIFPIVAQEWYEDLFDYAESLDLEKKDWINRFFLSEFTIERKNGVQILNKIWEDKIQTSKNGFVTNFSINRNVGGGIYFNSDDLNCRSGGSYIEFSDEKKQEFTFDQNRFYIYASENIDFYPGALLLRNWAIKYMNEVFKETFK